MLPSVSPEASTSFAVDACLDDTTTATASRFPEVVGIEARRLALKVVGGIVVQDISRISFA
jgi:hypothetical protein